MCFASENIVNNRLFCCNHTCYCVGIVSVTSASASLYVTSASRYHPRYQSKSAMYIRGLISRNFAELAEAIPICFVFCTIHASIQVEVIFYLFFFSYGVCRTNVLEKHKSLL